MPNTTNFNWPTPADTDLVKDGAAAIRNLGNGIDTSLIDLKGGTTGQILSKASNADMDFTFITPNVGDITEVQAGTGISVASGTGPIPVITNTVATAFDAAGDLVYGTGADTFTKLSLGTAGKVLTVNSGATAPEWASAPASASNWSLLNAGGTALTGAATVTVTGISAKDKIMVIIDEASSASASAVIGVRVNTLTTSIYYRWGMYFFPGSTYSATNLGYLNGAGSFVYIGGMGDQATSRVSGGVTISGASTSGVKQFIAGGSGGNAGNSRVAVNLQGYIDESNAITSISVFSDTGNLDNGTVYVYTSAG